MSDARVASAGGQAAIEAAMAESEKRFRHAFERAGIGMAVTGVDGVLCEANGAFHGMLGYGPDAVPRGSIVDLIHPDDAEAMREVERRLLAGESEEEYLETRYLRRDGGVLWAEVGVFVVRDPEGRPLQFVIHQRDITQRREAEHRAAEGAQVLASILAASPVGITLMRNRRPIWVNDALVSMSGQTMEVQIANGPRRLYADDAEYERVGRALYGDAPEDGTREVDTTWIREDGPPLHVHLAARPLPDEGAGEGYLVTAEDVTERVRHERELRESEERFRTAFAQAPIGMSLTAVDGTLLRVNRALRTMLGRTEQEMIGGNMARVTHADDVELTRCWMRHLVESGEEMCRFGKRFVHSDGHTVLTELNSYLLRDAEGRPLHFITHIQDVTERRRAEDLLVQSERRFREMSDLLPDMVFELDISGRFTYINRAVSEATGYGQADLDAGLDLSDVMDRATLVRATEGLVDTITRGRSLIGDYSIRCKDGRFVPTEVHAMGVLGSDGQRIGYRGVARDITDRHKLEDAQRLAALGQLAAGVAHEFNNLLAGLMLQAELTDEEQTIEGHEQLVRTALAVATRGRDVCRNLTTFARPPAPRREPLYAEAVIEAALALAAHQIRNAEVALTRDYQTSGQRVYADGGQLGQVFVNLFVNACHAMPQGGRLTIATRYVEHEGGAGEVVVTVSDTGTGIAAEHLPRIFEPFFTTKGRLGESGTPGSGLGLSVSHGIIEANGGTITARSELGAGTTIELVLPAHAGDAPVETAGEAGAVAPVATPCGRQGRILVAEDDPSLCALVEAALRAAGHASERASTATDAIAALQGGHYDLVITDLLMPGGGGQAVLEFARALDGAPPVLVVTGLMDAKIAEDALAMGACGVIRKPVSRADLVRMVDELLAR